MRTLFALLIGLTSLIGVFPASAQDATPTVETASAARTNLRYFLPYTPDGLAAGLNVVAETSGVCLFPSLADVGRPDAWACMDLDTNEIFDPCFEDPFAPSDGLGDLVCVASPFSPDVLRFSLTEPLQRMKDFPAEDGSAPRPPPDAPQPPMSPAGPEAVGPDEPAPAPDERADVVIDPLEIPWALELANGSRCGLLTGATAVLAGQRINYGCDDGGLVIGEVDRSAAMWTVAYLADGASATDLVDVVTAWT
jgi:hypothetical protein